MAHDNLEDFPLPEGFFNCEPLTQVETRYLESLGQNNICKLLLLNQHFYDPNLWPCVRNTLLVRVFQGLPPPSEPNIIPFRASTMVNATFQEVSWILSNLTTEQIENSMHKYANDVLDMKILYHIAAPASNQQIFVRWMAIECPKPLRNRDFCVLEVHHQTVLESGRRAYLISQHSIRLPGCPDLKSAYNLVRGSIYNSGIIITETNTPGVLEIQTHFQMDLKGKVPQWYHKYILRQRASRLDLIHASLDDLHATMAISGSFIPKIPLDSRTYCAGCRKCFNTFPKWRRKHHCQICGEVYCSKCARITATENKKHRVCYSCVGKNIESSIRSPCPSGGDIYSKLLLEDEDGLSSLVGSSTSTCRYNPSISTQMLLQLMGNTKETNPRKQRHDDGITTLDVDMDALRLDWHDSSALPMLEMDTMHTLRLL
ncbi:hypothetical protein THRCLA_22664 [Thraustotheca clavata]|uniref:FYVE-type domain-containing protein n=1 Tax=Thraustotheca clavata TaxID=74557 RepID=A0A1V9YVI6_9STRA|nr:hypothetical protein THRCLA_22664 [Thraustotheca clavata]